ncbi:DUF1801 domain-containing protein [Aureibaculum sp. 2210JD6-5]|uniref:iron chaperone n=1 Tax=Aureibaculum sp. 2210JD6-5 TaxID=3103957 RepID=UPI002AADE721|nr:DUF1801 domain-containing protein [Aureibaculum sp. 2210JD6-5]MDY7396881.1 DUF1801 domain-containing protein [Aureibaculum sp. 2210JD6-5]
MANNYNKVLEYLEDVPEKRKTALIKIRELCLKHLPDHEEGMFYKVPSYKRNNQVEVAFASQKQHITIYFLIHEVMLNSKELLTGTNHGKGTIRYSNPAKINYDLIETLLKQTNQSQSQIC